ncbi:MAG: hypothetical protein ACTSYZ_01190 [Candidatus Helarchaeota archaeon]
MNKVKSNRKFKFNIPVLVSTILIIILSLFSVFSAFFIFNVQLQVKKYSQENELRYSVLNIIEKDIDKILSDDTQRQQISLDIQQEMLSLNENIKNMKNYNATHPGTYNQSDIDKKAIQFVSKMKILNELIRNSLPYNWSLGNFGTHENNYTVNYTQYYLIIDRYPQLKKDLDLDILNMINKSLNKNETEILEINIYNWESELFNNLEIVEEYGQYSKIYNLYTNTWISGFTYYEIVNEADKLSQIAGTYDQSGSIMTTALVLLTVAGVIIAFVVSIDQKIFIWITLIIGAIVALIGLYLFDLSFLYLSKASIMAIYW